jgi:N4-gp56 family major capsid protein
MTVGVQAYTTAAGRINKLKGEILAHALPVEVLGITGQNKSMPKNKGDTVIYRRWLPYGATTSNANTINRPLVSATAHLTTEGVTPSAENITPQDVTVVLLQYACLYAITDKTYDLYEDDVPAEMKKQVGERMGLVREMIRFGALKANTNVYYIGGTTLATVASTVTYNSLSKVARNLMANHAKAITRILSASPNFDTSPVEAGFLVFCHTDCEHDIRLIPDFIHVSRYGQRKVIHEMELGTVGRFRFIVSPELASTADSGVAIGSTGLYSTTGTLIDCYPMIVCAEDAWGDVALRGSSSMDPTWIPPGQKDKTDPLGQRGYAGAKFYSAAKVLNDGWMALMYVGVTSL